jgi:hypothetical protein
MTDTAEPRATPEGEPPPHRILPAVTASDAPLPSMRSLEDALALLAEIERGAIEVFGRAGLPTLTGLYRRGVADGDWERLADDLPADARWREILDRPPEAGFRYLSLADVGRTQHPGSPDIQSAAATLDRAEDLRRLLRQGAADGEEDPALMMFWSTVELMAVLFGGGGRKEDGRTAGRRAVVWETWRAEAGRVWNAEPELSARMVAKLVVQRLALNDSPHTVRRRLSGFQPVPADRS